MNRLLGKKSVQTSDDGASGRESRRWKKGKKVQEEPKPQFDLSSALPTNDDFRTSLILPNLSARFSMLREQDDPTSKLGKASDDSVLTPKRKSKLPNFGLTGPYDLGDIAEVRSISSGAPRPWLDRNPESFTSDDSHSIDADTTSSANGSVMNRARPFEGNNLFGGRQKVFKIPTSTSVKSLGRLVYEEDMSMSAFQKHKQAERDAAAHDGQFDDSEHSDTGSLPFGLVSSSADLTGATHSRAEDSVRWNSMSESKRQHSAASSAGSDGGQDSASTPATSLASQPLTSPLRAQVPNIKPMMATPAAPLERSGTKRRLYDQGLDQNMQEQQASALTRLNSIQRQRAPSGNKSPNLSYNAANQSGYAQDRPVQQYQAPPLSPTNPLTTFDSIYKAQSFTSSPPTSLPTSPTFTPVHEYDEMGILSSTVKPSDRGKATAMGAFHMPRQQYDEEQYVRRLQQLHNTNASNQQDRGTGVAGKSSSPSLARFDSARQPVDHQVPNPEQRTSSDSSSSKAEDAPSPNAFSVFQKAAAQMRAQHADAEQLSSPASVPDTHRTFFGDISASDDDDEDILSENDRRGYLGATAPRFKPTELENIQEDTAANSMISGAEFHDDDSDDEDRVLPPQPLRTFASKPSLADSAKGQFDFELSQQSSTQETKPGDDAPRALGGLIHQHLRNTSNVSSSAPSMVGKESNSNHLRQPSDQSSVYTSTIGRDDSAPNFAESKGFGGRAYGGQNRLNNYYTNSNPWDLDDLDTEFHFGDPAAHKAAGGSTPTQEQRALASSVTKISNDAASQRSSDTSNWQPDHKRELSAGTVEEREAFAMELAARQKAIQEKMKAIAEVESRGSSPQPVQASTFKSFGMLKPKISGDLAPKQEVQGNKAMKMLGLGAGGSSTSLSSMRKPSYASEDNRSADSRNHSAATSPRPSYSQRTPPIGDQKTRGMYDMQRPRGDSEASRQGKTSMGRPSPPMSSQPSMAPAGQPRSSSLSSSTRGPSRQERMLSDAGLGLSDTGSRSNSIRPNMSPRIHQDWSPVEAKASPHGTPRHSPNLVQKPLALPEHGRPRGNSKSAGSSPTEAKPPMPTQLPNGLRLMPSSSSPAPLNTSFKQAANPAARSSPLQSPHMTGPLSPISINSPLSPSAIGTQTYIPTAKQQGSALRKKVVQKSEISDPVLISSTSNVDTVDLPPGASLRNGMEVAGIPAANARRRKLFGFGKDGKDESGEQSVQPVARYPNPGAPPPLPQGAVPRVFSPEPYREHPMQQQFGTSASAQGPRSNPRAVRSDESIPRQQLPMQNLPQRQLMTEGGMF